MIIQVLSYQEALLRDWEEAIQATIEENAEALDNWLAGKPGSWGFLAGKAVVACRRRLGRPLTDGERRLIWDMLWQRLQQIRQRQP